MNENINDSRNNSSNNIKNECQAVQYLNAEKKEEEQKKVEEKVDKLLYLIIISGLQIIPTALKFTFYDKLKSPLTDNMSVLMESLFFIVFSTLFLGFSLYRHQYVSLLIIIICLITFYVQSLLQFEKIDIIYIFQSFLFAYTYETFYCISDVLGKKYLNLYMDGLYLFLFKIGIIGTISLLIIDTFAYFFDLNFNGIIVMLGDLNISFFLFNILCYFIFDISLWLTIYYFSPCHYILLDTISNFIDVIFVSNDHLTKVQRITFIILYPILFFAALVFNEIIILDFCGLSYNTQLFISERGKAARNSYTDSDLDELENVSEDSLIEDNEKKNEENKEGDEDDETRKTINNN